MTEGDDEEEFESTDVFCASEQFCDMASRIGALLSHYRSNDVPLNVFSTWALAVMNVIPMEKTDRDYEIDWETQ